MNFPYGIRLPNPPGSTFKAGRIEPLYVGLTIRGFYYAPEASTKESIMELQNYANLSYYWAKTVVVEDKLKFDYKGYPPLENRGRKDTQAKLAVPGYYSVAIRFKDAAYLSILHNDEEAAAVYEKTVFGSYYGWTLFFEGGAPHLLLSLHISAETDVTARPLGQQFYLENPWFAIGGSWLIECSVQNVNTPLDVNLWFYKDGKLNTTGSAKFPLRNVKQGDVVTILIRSSRDHFVVTSSFDNNTITVIGLAGSGNPIYPSLSNNCEILRQYAEIGTYR